MVNFPVGFFAAEMFDKIFWGHGTGSFWWLCDVQMVSVKRAFSQRRRTSDHPGFRAAAVFALRKQANTLGGDVETFRTDQPAFIAIVIEQRVGVVQVDEVFLKPSLDETGYLLRSRAIA